MSTVAISMVKESFAASRCKRVEMSRVAASFALRPSITPTATNGSVSFITKLTTSNVRAPRAIRMPVSLGPLVTALDMMLLSPTLTIGSAKRLKKAAS